ncbi:MAG: hypothetical protein IJV26_11225 [Lachnospiraceae bacterium]|nr:hypothetical protein [Lachnospiraceae bacterium]
MNNNRFEFKSSLLLVEIIITVFFFALSGIGCIRLYLKAHDLAQQARQSTGAVVAAQNLAEAYICAGGNPEQAAQLLGEIGAGAATGKDGNNESLSIYYDSDWMLLESASEAAFHAFLTESVNSSEVDAGQPVLHTARIEVLDSAGKMIYEIPELNVLEGGETP